MGKIYYMMGKSASGKDTIYQILLERCPKLKRVVLYTTRPMRDGERDGVQYFFTTPQQIDAFEAEGKLIEKRTYQTVAGPWIYATIDDGSFDLEHQSFLAIGTLESYEMTVRYFGEEHVEPIYITVDDGVRLERALNREKQQKQPRYAEMCRRYLADEADFAPENLERNKITSSFDNTELEVCVGKILSVIQVL